MRSQDKSKENHTPAVSYRFGDFELLPRERLLQRQGEPVTLAAKAFDALLCLVRNPQHLVTKDELIQTLWPSTHVTEANLTNTIVSLRKVLGREAIDTVSKHGYRFVLPVQGEPGIRREIYERFMRAKDLSRLRSLESIQQAQSLFWVCLADDPSFAPAWAWLGRCCWFRNKFASATRADLELAEAAFRRAFALDPDLACAHQFYTPVETDTGHARQALTRLQQRLRRHTSEPESFAGLVQVLRFCGLLPESLHAHRRAMDLDPAIGTSVPHTLFLAGDYEATIETYGGRTGYYLDAAAWAALGQPSRARVLLQERLALTPLSALMAGLMESLLAVVEKRFDDAVRVMKSMPLGQEPEALVYLARHYSLIGDPGAAAQLLNQAAGAGFVCAPSMLQSDPWLSAVRDHPAFPALRNQAERLSEEARVLL